MYQEALACLQYKLDNKQVIYDQIEEIRKDGFPARKGLFSTGFLIRENIDSVNRLNEMWYDYVTTKSIRDQLSLTYCAWKLDVYLSNIPVGRSVYNNPYLHRRVKHKKPNQYDLQRVSI